MSHMHTKINDLRQQSMQKVLETIMVLIGSLYTTLLLPQLLLRYVYVNQQLTAEPKALELIPVIAFAVSVLYLIYAVAGNFARNNQIKQLQTELETMHDDCDCGHDHYEEELTDEELAELEAMVDTAIEDDTSNMAEAMKPKKSAKKTSKKSKK